MRGKPIHYITEILATHLGESWTRHLCLGLTIVLKINKECARGTHDFLVRTQNCIVQESLSLISQLKVFIRLRSEFHRIYYKGPSFIQILRYFQTTCTNTPDL
jgi:hypothetical protein